MAALKCYTNRDAGPWIFELETEEGVQTIDLTADGASLTLRVSRKGGAKLKEFVCTAETATKAGLIIPESEINSLGAGQYVYDLEVVNSTYTGGLAVRDLDGLASWPFLVYAGLA